MYDWQNQNPWPNTRIGPLPGITLTEDEVDKLYGLKPMRCHWRKIEFRGAAMAWTGQTESDYPFNPDLSEIEDNWFDTPAVVEEECGAAEIWQANDVTLAMEIEDQDIARSYARLELLERFHPERARLVRSYFLDQINQQTLATMENLSQPTISAKIKSGVEWMQSLSDDAVLFLTSDEESRLDAVSQLVKNQSIAKAVVLYTTGLTQLQASNGLCNRSVLSICVHRLMRESTQKGLVDSLKTITSTI